MPMRQIPLAIGPAPAPGFDNFLPGPNAAAHAELLAIVAARSDLLAAPTVPVPPIYLWGPAGAGKTHLLRALAGSVQGAGPAVGWFDAADPQPWFWMPAWRLVVIDRCEALSDAAQQAAFALFVEAAAHGAQVAAAGRLPPVDLPLRADLKSRLGWGHVLALQPLDDAQTKAVLRSQAEHRGMQLPDDVLSYLLSRFERDLSHLMRMLDALDDYALVHGRRLSVPLLRAMLADQGLDDAVAGAVAR
jgi:DnaA family protein